MLGFLFSFIEGLLFVPYYKNSTGSRTKVWSEAWVSEILVEGAGVLYACCPQPLCEGRSSEICIDVL